MPLPLTVSCFSKIQIGFTFLVPAHPGSPGRRAVKQGVCVCVCVCARARACVFLSVCVSVCKHIWNYTSDLLIFFCMLPLAVVWSSSGSTGGTAICYVLPVSWVASYMLIIASMEACRYTCRLRALLHRIGCVVSCMMAGAETRVVYCASGASSGACSAPLHYYCYYYYFFIIFFDPR